AIRHTFIPDIKPGQKKGYDVTRRDEPLLISDPYAKSLDKALHYHPPYTPAKSFDMPKCVVIEDTFDWQETDRPRIPRE
ncbi:glycogen debranching enzyme, partial [Vibrio parahaemolyticus]|nr:glycogen debranching enzyme [Vibrio parahaemolyticus]